MGSLVSNEMGAPAEGLATVLTFKTFLLRVVSQVLGKRRTWGEESEEPADSLGKTATGSENQFFRTTGKCSLRPHACGDSGQAAGVSALWGRGQRQGAWPRPARVVV